MKTYTETLIGQLKQIFSTSVDINFDLKLPDICIDINRAIPCGLILNELITNALKYAFIGRREGKLSISLKRLKSNSHEITVMDNGVGLPEDIERKKQDSLGLQLVTMLTKQLQGQLIIESQGGAKFQIIFPQ